MLKENKMQYQFPFTSSYSKAAKKSIITHKHETLQ